MARGKLLVEGWRFLPHSYAMVNQWQLLALQRHSDVELRVRDLPLFMPSWQTQDGMFDADAERRLHALKPPEPDFAPDVTLRIGFPYDLAPAPRGRTVVFCTSEYQTYQKTDWVRRPEARSLRARQDLSIVTPSRWSAEGLQRSGVPVEKINIVPHGVDTALFKPDVASAAATRTKLGIGRGVVFMNASAMTINKGIDILLRAFAEVYRQRSDVYLLLKGTDALYKSGDRLNRVLGALNPALRNQIATRIVYGGATVSTEEMAALYRAADVYVSPYRAEGFNLPVLEAMASGRPVICTAGGPTDSFVGDDCGLKIPSSKGPVALAGASQGIQLQPDENQLVRLMLQAAGDVIWRGSAGAAGRRRAAELSWDKAVDRLLEVLF